MITAEQHRRAVTLDLHSATGHCLTIEEDNELNHLFSQMTISEMDEVSAAVMQTREDSAA